MVKEVNEPWYKHRWPWVVFGLPAMVVVASLITLYVAIKTDDGVVVDDYYKKGLAVNEDLTRVQKARDLQLVGKLMMHDNRLELSLQSKPQAVSVGQPLKFSAQNYAAKTQDVTVTLLPTANGTWTAQMPQAMATGRWQLLIESTEWQIQSEVTGIPQGTLIFKADEKS